MYAQTKEVITMEEQVKFNFRVSKAEKEAYDSLCRTMHTTISRELKLFIRQQLHAQGLWDPKKGLIKHEINN